MVLAKLQLRLRPWKDEAPPNRGTKFKRALEVADNDDEVAGAVVELKGSFYSVTNAGSQTRRRQDAVARTRASFHFLCARSWC